MSAWFQLSLKSSPLSGMSSRQPVLYLALAELLFSIVFLILGIFLLYTLGERILDVDAVALNLHIFAYFFLGLATTLGISGAFFRSRSLVTMFCSLTLAQLVFGIGSGVYCLAILFDDPGELVTQALHHKCASMDHISRGFCERTSTMQYLTLTFFVQLWFAQIAGIFFSQAYVQELIDEGGDGMKEMDYEYEYGYAYYGDC
ncbi:hypothetical protein D9757_002948 [Collybiopsis confluens]|uniref:Uncharacterized protein n=1 Tax=Collybiopsis confluens TaxID=2823264 RepID=A0A8H5HVR0_9AGAR|nr:hypothetical protein D9757_002948 [Collybiopsis confluens]